MQLPFIRVLKIRSVLLISLLVLSACSQKTIQVVDQQEQIAAFQARQAVVSQITSWDVEARLAITADGDRQSGSIVWQQQDDILFISLTGAFGVTIAKINGDSAGYSLQDRQGDIWQAESIDELILQRTGWLLPISQMQNWLLADSENVIAVELNADGTLAAIQYEDWQIDYQSYMLVDNVLLPKKLAVNTEDIELKIVIRNWQL